MPSRTALIALAATRIAMAGSRFKTAAMPPAMLASAAGMQAGGNPWFSLSSESTADDARRLSSLGCSTSSSDGGGSNAAAWRAAGRGLRLRSRRLPLASMSLHDREPGGAAAAGPGHLRWQHSSSSSSSSSAAAGAADAPAAPELPTAAELKAAAAAATAPDVFQRGQVLAGGRYQLLRKLGEGPDGLMEGLGEGRFATVWLGSDASSGQAVVLKLLEAGDGVSYTAGTREAALQAMAGRHPNVVALLDAFEHRSSKGRHACMVLEHCGTNLLVISSQFLGNDVYARRTGRSIDAIRHMPTLKHIAKQLLQGLQHLHSRGIAHMDLSTDNVVIDKIFRPAAQLTAIRLWGSGVTSWFKSKFDGVRAFVFKSERVMRRMHEGMIQSQMEAHHSSTFYTESTLARATFKLADFGRAVPFEQLRQQQRDGPAAAAAGAVLPARQYNQDGIVVMGDPRYRPPEELLGLAYQGPEYDVWRLGCLMYRLAVGTELFESTVWAHCFDALAHDASASSYDFNDMHLLEMANVLGDLPRDFIRSSPVWRRYFTPADQLRVANKLSVTRRPGSIALPELLAKQCGWMEQTERQQFSDFLKLALALDPAKRAKASDMLQHKWLQDAPSEGGGNY